MEQYSVNQPIDVPPLVTEAVEWCIGTPYESKILTQDFFEHMESIHKLLASGLLGEARELKWLYTRVDALMQENMDLLQKNAALHKKVIGLTTEVVRATIGDRYSATGRNLRF